MENLEIKGYKEDYFIPTVLFNAESGICEIEGESYLDDAADFYEPLLNWLEKYFEEVDKPVIFNFKLSYFNTSSSKRIYQIMNYLKAYEDAGGEVTVNWYFKKEDEDLVDEIDDLRFSTELEINYIMENE